MDWLWTWSGKSFGYRDGDGLWTHDGRHVGRFDEEEVYDPDGRYLGEERSGRLIRSLSKKSWRRAGFASYANRVGHVQHVDYVGNVMVVGYEDFPGPDAL